MSAPAVVTVTVTVTIVKYVTVMTAAARPTVLEAFSPEAAVKQHAAKGCRPGGWCILTATIVAECQGTQSANCHPQAAWCILQY